MTHHPHTPFDSIEGAYEYVTLLIEALEEAAKAIRGETDSAGGGQGAARRLEALHLVDYKLKKLREHLTSSRRILNDLRTLRRLLLSERDEAGPEE